MGRIRVVPIRVEPQPLVRNGVEKYLDDYVNAVPSPEREARMLIRERALNAGAQLHSDGTFFVAGDLNCANCIQITALPDNLIVNGNLNLSNCIRLRKLPSGLSVGGSLDLFHCVNLSDLPWELSVGTYLYLSGSSWLTHLPQGLRVGGYLYLAGCTGLTELPSALHVGGSLDLRNCTNLIRLPRGLCVGDSLYLSGCTRLSSLPVGLNVHGNLYLSGCVNLMYIPWQISIGGDIDLRGCVRLTRLSSDISRWGPRFDHQTRHIYVQNTGLSDRVVAMLSATAPGIVFHGTHPQFFHRDLTLVAALDSWMDADERHAVARLNVTSWGLDGVLEDNLRLFLIRLHDTAEAKNLNARQNLQRRVLGLLQSMAAGDDDYRQLVISVMEAYLTDCDDAIMQGMDVLDETIEIRLAESSHDPESALRRLAPRFLALEIVRRHIDRKIQSLMVSNLIEGQWDQVDAIEVQLAYKIGVTRRGVQLPTTTQHMIFYRCSKTTDPDIQRAVDDVKLALGNPETVRDFADNWAPWKSFQERAKRNDVAARIFYSELPLATEFQIANLGPEPCCEIGLDSLESLDDPVIWGGHLYGLAALKRWWISTGTHPSTRVEIPPDQLDAQIFRLSPGRLQSRTTQ